MAEANDTPTCTMCGNGFEQRTGPGRRYTRCSPCRVENKRPRRSVACHGCGITVQRPARLDEAARYCSRKCNTESMARVALESAALTGIAKAWAWRPSAVVVAETEALYRIARYVDRPRLTLRPCISCGADAVGTLEYRRQCRACKRESAKEQARLYRATPAGRAQRKRDKAVRRARIAIAEDLIDPIAVFARDKWTCCLCGKRTPKRLRGTCSPDAPELDHIIPLALGGGHVWGNVQCACRECNGKKGASIQGQLGLPLAA